VNIFRVFLRHEDFLANDSTTTTDPPIKGKEFKYANSGNTNVEDPEYPTKCTRVKQAFVVNCQIQFIDFEGRSDGESLQKIIEQMEPRRLIITRGSDESRNILANVLQKNVDSKVFIPKIGEILDVTTESHIYQVKLKDSLVSSLVFKRGKDAELAWVDGTVVIQAEGQPGSSDMDEAGGNQEVQLMVPVLEPLLLTEVNNLFVLLYLT